MRKPLLYSLYTIMNPAGGSDVEGSELGGRSTAGLKSPRIYWGLLSLSTFLCSAQHYYSFQIGPLPFRMLNELPAVELAPSVNSWLICQYSHVRSKPCTPDSKPRVSETKGGFINQSRFLSWWTVTLHNCDSTRLNVQPSPYTKSYTEVSELTAGIENGRLQISATWFHCTAILYFKMFTFAIIALCVASQRVLSVACCMWTEIFLRLMWRKTVFALRFPSLENCIRKILSA